MTDEQWMQRALDLARQASEQGEVPVGAVLVRGNVWKATFSSLDAAYDLTVTSKDCSLHFRDAF